MKVMVISLLLLWIPYIHAQELLIKSPEQVVFNEPFSVTLRSSITDLSDVKIYVKNDTNDRLSMTFNGTIWKSSFFYISSSFPLITTYQLKVTKYSSSLFLCTKLRITATQKTLKEVCLPLQMDPLSPTTPEEVQEHPPDKNQELPSITSNESLQTTLEEQPSTPLRKKEVSQKEEEPKEVEKETPVQMEPPPSTRPLVEISKETIQLLSSSKKIERSSWSSPELKLPFLETTLFSLLCLGILLLLLKKKI